MTGQAGGLFPVVSETATDALGFAPAKINLSLRVTGRRADGYHLLDSLVVFAKVGDRLSVKPAETLSLSVSGPFGSGLSGEGDNLVLRAARALAAEAGIAPRGALVLDKVCRLLPASAADPPTRRLPYVCSTMPGASERQPRSWRASRFPLARMSRSASIVWPCGCGGSGRN